MVDDTRCGQGVADNGEVQEQLKLPTRCNRGLGMSASEAQRGEDRLREAARPREAARLREETNDVRDCGDQGRKKIYIYVWDHFSFGGDECRDLNS